MVDGLDVRDWRVPELRRQFSMVQQDVHLFSGTVLDNIGWATKPSPRRTPGGRRRRPR